MIAARSIALFRNEKGWNFLIKILEYYEVDVNEYVPEFKFKLETIKHIQQLIHQGDYFFALDISKWKESISKNESSVALRV